MMRATPLIGTTLFILSSPVFAQSPDPTVVGLDACFRQSRLADKICEGQTDSGARLDCFKKTRDAQLECLTHIAPGAPTASTPPSREAVPSPPSASSEESPNNPPKNTGSIEQTAPSSSSGSSDSPGAPKVSEPGREATTPVRSDGQTIEKGSLPQENRWVVSETTSPVDYSALVTAVLQAAQAGDDGPSGLVMRCRAKRTEFLLQFRGNSAGRKADGQQIHFQIGDQPPVQLDWSWSPDGKIVTLKNDPVPVLQFLPEGATLKIWTGDRVRQNTEFQLVGLDGIRRKVAAACNWAAQRAQTSSGKK